MNLFQFVQDIDMGKFFVSARHENNKVTFIGIYPIVDDLIYPAFSLDLKDMQPLIDMIERKILEAN